MNAATATEWLTAAAIGTSTLPLLAAAAAAAGSDWQLPHLSLAPAVETAEQAVQAAGLRAAAWLLVLAWHLETREATR